MKIKSLKNWLMLLGGSALILTSCEKTGGPDITANNLKGVFVVCEGNYGSADGDITYYNNAQNQSITSLYYSVNDVPLGDVVQSFTVADTLGFIVVNNSQKVTVVNMKNFTEVKTIYGFSYPRSTVRADQNTVYVTNGNGFSDNYIYSIDLATLNKTDSLEVASGPENIIAVDSKVYAAISGGWNNDGNTVIEIDPVTFSVVNTFEVASVPVDLVPDKNKNIWVYCKGVPDYSNYPDVTYTGMGLSMINVSTKAVTYFPFTSMSAPGIYNIAAGAGGNTIYYLNDGLYAIPVSATALPVTSLVEQAFYGVEIDPESGEIVCLDAINSKAVVYNTSGVEQFSFETETFPNSVVFCY